MDNYPLDCHLTFSEIPQVPLAARAINIDLTTQHGTLSECRLTLKVSPTAYQRIDTQALFNLNSEFRSPVSNGDFQPDRPVQLEVTLHPDLLLLLLDHAQTAEEATAYLQTLSQQQAEQLQATAGAEQSADNPEDLEPAIHPLLYTENWFCLSVKQQQDSGETGYTTFWNYVNPALLNQPDTASDRITEGIANFVKDWTTANLSAATQDITEDLFKGVTTLFDGFDTWLDNAFAEDSGDGEDDIDDDSSILETIIEFFTEDDWTFTKLQGQSILQVACQGKNGRWNCYAQAREDQNQFVFYSIYPEAAPEDKRLAMAEFLTRANYGLIIGNFEMDFNDGEIRYKTSIDVEGDLLTSELVKQLVYANVMMMDHYLPGIESVMDGRLSPEKAIDHIDNPTPIPTNSSSAESRQLV